MVLLRTAEYCREAAASIGDGAGPFLLECMTYRWRGHVGPGYDVGENLRSQEELDSWMEKCPVKSLEKILLENNLLSDSEMSQMRASIDLEVQDAIRFARESDYPDAKALF